MNPTYVGVEFTRHIRDGYNLFFSLLMPSAMYLLFGNIPSYGEEVLGLGNVKFYIMASMAAYGAAISTVAIAGTVATESMQGWGRQIALTRMSPATFVSSKMFVATTIAAISAALVYALGAATGATTTEWWLWIAAFGITMVGSLMFACYGIGVGMLFKSESALGLASGLMVFFAFFGNVFMPLSGMMLDIARFTPMYGYVALVRFLQLQDVPAETGFAPDALWIPVTNVVLWAAFFAIFALIATRKARARQ
ncbi:ABC transporter permease [Arthrobacter sp. MYb211]|uniref:ABC transporter permease n=1 Tax=Micrococcaceae TaxID=1268 RepID=UPI000CFD3986|nr:MULTISPECIES: ABC transporter permease [unclassified Arthrobacter]PRA00344.1 ABC transporter permease [Arthrobacter sp. MYb224]PRA04536.1 ABC transporter permease [Arthrobacter sp. MYb229]PRA12268.1 ABC transporter permease [Arthrobacter sp. MYb221]PRB51552.1 ABC transporter permease [Arthrobacter sp. MYb216]PRC08730.1 ABC transporter permease [Arthrobacter sp. MYb211]